MMVISFSGARDVWLRSMRYVIVSVLPVHELETLALVLMRHWDTAGTAIDFEAHDTARLGPCLTRNAKVNKIVYNNIGHGRR